jgi:deoxyribodipyrimidine photo-lyase
MDFANAVFWMRYDLRLADNPALLAALEESKNVTILYILEQDKKIRDRGAANKWWLHHALKSLQTAIIKKGGTLVIRKGVAKEIIPAFLEEVNADAIFWNRCYEPEMIDRDTKLKATLQNSKITVKTFNSALLSEPWEIKTYSVFTPYWKKLQDQPIPRPLTAPDFLTKTHNSFFSEKLEDLGLLTVSPDWAGGLRDIWNVSEAAAIKRLDVFLEENVAVYAEERDRPDKFSTSKLSPFLALGLISPRHIWYKSQQEIALNPSKKAAVEKFLSEIGWREFSYHLLFHFPTLPDKNLRKNFDTFPWQPDPIALKAWQKGQTGYPIIDAGMRELWHTGWMHNRVRMLVASFLIKDLLIPWQQGEAWFWDTLVDADLASNSASWQWVAGCGADAAPYFRIFNPTTQAQKFDPEGLYVKKWVPELRKLPAPQIHEPWNCSISVLKEAGVRLGKDYPLPLIDHATARDRALAAFERIKIAQAGA